MEPVRRPSAPAPSTQPSQQAPSGWAIGGTSQAHADPRDPGTGPTALASPMQAEGHRPPGAKEDGPTTAAPNLPLAIGAGLGVAIAFALLWGGVAWKTGYELGLIAWLMGAAIGFVVMRTSGRWRGYPLAAAALGLTALGVLLAKYTLLYLVARDQVLLEGGTLSPFDPALIAFFPTAFGALFSLMDVLFVAAALFAAWRTTAPTRQAKAVAAGTQGQPSGTPAGAPHAPSTEAPAPKP